VRSLRDQLAADMVVLVSQDSDWCGYASLSIANGNADAYAVVYSSCLSSQSLAHEVGHLQQVDHNRENGGNGGAYPYGYGYRVCASNGFRDIMSYQCTSTSVPRILQFSNPIVSYNGYATGISYEASPSTSAETARALNNTATTVAAYRTPWGRATSPTPTVPVAPSSLTAPSVAYNAVSLKWSDNSSDESGFTLARSSDGVNYSVIATLGAGTTSFTDGSISARTSYYYRVQAYNSVGVSAYSNTLSVTTPDVPAAPPAAPTSVTAGDNADGTALVSWTPGSSTATSYEARREKWDARKSRWTSLTTVATVPASYTQIVDASGAGTFRYTVRATNSGGASGYAGPANVTVTKLSTTTNKRKK
jgi:hypothetical protein